MTLCKKAPHSFYITTPSSMMVKNLFNLSRDLARPRDQSVLKLSGMKLIVVGNLSAGFSDYRHFDSGYLFLISHLTSRNHGLSDFMGRRLSR